MKLAWITIYLLASIQVVGMFMSATGFPFGKEGFNRPVSQLTVTGFGIELAVSAPALQAPAVSATGPSGAPSQ